MRATDRVDLDRIVFIGRTYAEYLKMFDLDEKELSEGAVLDCPAGPSSFGAEARARGLSVTAADVLYGSAPADLADRGRRDIEHAFQRVGTVPHLYVWKAYRDREEVISLRHRALERFMKDYSPGNGAGRYVRALLPRLPFSDRFFNLVLSSHFLFLYGDRLSAEFHIAALLEMARVSAREVRVYPLQGLDAKPYAQMDDVLSSLRAAGVHAEVVPTAFEFQRGADSQLVLRR